MIDSLYTDSDSSAKLHSNTYACRKSKHIVKQLAALRDWVLRRVLAIFHIPGKRNPADIFTKALGRDVFVLFRDAILTGRVFCWKQLPT